MTHLDLERELRNHYRSLDAGSPVRVTSRVADALDRAPERRWNPGAMFRTRWARVAGIAAAAAAVLAVATLPLWSVRFGGPAASATTTYPDFGPGPTGTYSLAVAGARVDQAGMTKDGTIWATWGSVLDVSVDHGTTWRQSKLPTTTAGQATLPGGTPSPGALAVVDAEHAWYLWSAGYAHQFTVFRTSDGGSTWQSTVLTMPAGVESSATGTSWSGKLYFVDALVGFAVLDTTATESSDSGPRTVMRTVDGGVTWKATGTAAALADIVAVDANTLWAPDLNNGSVPQPLLQVSRDAGATWSDVPLPGLAATGSDSLLVLRGPSGGVQFLSAAEGYMAVLRKTASSYETLYFGTTDGGRSWSPLATWSQGVEVAPVFLDAKAWYQVGLVQGLHSLSMGITMDGGATWGTTVPDNNWPSGGPVQAFWMVDGTNSAILSNGSLFLSSDTGITWQPAAISAR